MPRGRGEVASVEGSGLDPVALKAAKAGVETRIKAALIIFIIAACALFGPQVAALVELFPTRVCDPAMSLPCNIGTGWVGGLLPAASFALLAWSGNIYFGLWYSVVFTAIAAVVALIWLPETRGHDLTRSRTERQPP